MININFGHNRELLERCKPLGEYSWFTDNVNRKQREFGNPEKAVDAALDEMPDGFLIKPFLIANKAEVKSMCLTEYDEAKCKAMDREEGRAEGRAEGRMEGLEEGTVRTLLALVKDGIISEETAAGKAKMSVAEFRKAAERFCQ